MFGTHLRTAAQDLLAPPRCPACRRGSSLSADVGGLCARCRRVLGDARPRALLLGPRRGLEVLAAVPYVPPATGLVTALKSGRVPGAAATMAELIAAALPLPLPADALLVPVGAARWRNLQRGLDPAAEIAIALAALLDLEASPSLLTRRRSTPQRGRTREARLASPPTFTANPGPVPARPVLLVDDVVTTGGTLLACARALEAAGVCSAGAACFAWTPPPS